MNLKKTVSLLAAAMMLLTGCKDSSSVTDDALTTAPAQTESSAEATDTTAAETSLTAASAGSTAETSGSRTEAVSGTAPQQSAAPESTVTTSVQSSQGAGGVTTTVSAAAKKPLRTALSALSAKGEVYSVLDAGNGRAVVGCSNSAGVSTAYLIDLSADRQINSFRLKNSFETLVGVTQGNELVCANYYSESETTANLELIFYDLTTGNGQSVTCDTDEYADLRYDRDTDMIYGTCDKELRFFERDGSVRSARKVGPNGNYINTYIPKDRISLEAEVVRNDGTGSELAAYDTVSGTRLYGFDDHYTSVYPVGGKLLYTEGTYDEAKKKSVANAYLRDIRTGAELRRCKIFEGQHDLFTSAYSDYAFMLQWNEKNWRPSAIIPFDPAAGKRAKSGIALSSNTTAANLCYIRDLGLWAAAVTEGANRNAVTRISLIDPAQSDFGKTFDSVYDYGIASTKSLGKRYQPLKEITDRIERSTGVRVRIGNEVLSADQPSGYQIVSAEDDTSITVDEERAFLLSLEKKLNLYPAGFFDKLKLPTESGSQRVGLRILVVDSLITTAADSTFTAGGLAYEGSAWYNIAIADYMLSEYDNSIHHEIWHIIEDLLNNSGNPLNADAWTAANPKRFEYTNDFNNYYGHPEYESYLFTNDMWQSVHKTDSVYFSRDYSTVNGQEDRATLIERIFDNPSDYENMTQYRDGLEMVKAYPHLSAKLDVLAEAVRKCFGYVYWDEMYRSIRAAA